MKKIQHFAFLAALTLLVGAGCTDSINRDVRDPLTSPELTAIETEEVTTENELPPNQNKETLEEIKMEVQIESEEDAAADKTPIDLPNTTFMYRAFLEDVTTGPINGVSTDGKAFGTAEFQFYNEKFGLYATIGKLPDLGENFFYEGWLVRNNPFDVISTGELTKLEGYYANSFSSQLDYTDHNLYILTLEPNDGNPAPADHVVEGKFMKVSPDTPVTTFNECISAGHETTETTPRVCTWGGKRFIETL